MELVVESDGIIYDMTECCTKLSLSEPLNDGAGSLDFTYLYDGAEIIQMVYSSAVFLKPG